MRAIKKTPENSKILHDLVPLNSLTPERFRELLEKIIIEEVKSGSYLFRKGDRDNQTIFLLEGSVTLIDGFRKIAGEVHAGTEQSRHPISNLQPRQYAARTVKKSIIARIDSGLLDVFLIWDPSNTAEVVDIGAADNNDWMTRMLQSETFVRLPPSKLQALLMKFRPVEVSKGQVIIAQGDEGDHFYTIHEGRCAVTRQEAPGAAPQLLAELCNGDSFGEEALVSDSRRNASITMLTDGLLMRLSKQDFVDLLKTQMVRHVTYGEAKQLVDEGAVWLDVRTPDEYEGGSFEDSVNIPLYALRGEMPELVFNSTYVICCDTGSRSDSAAFVLSHRGFDVCVLDGGIGNLPLPADDVPQEDLETAGSGQVDAQTRIQLEGALAELEQERGARHNAEQQLKQVRGELAESGEKLGEYYRRVKRMEQEKQLFMQRYEALREKHEDQLQSLSDELEQEKARSRLLRGRLKERESECHVLRGQSGSAMEQSGAQQMHVHHLRGDTHEGRQIGNQIQQVTCMLDALRNSLHGIATSLSGTPEDATGQPACASVTERGGDIEK